MTLEFNAAPYYDDFSESKGFYRILFRPGRAVQARELTQLQTQIQTQIGYLGKHFFKEGALVLDGQQQVDYYFKFVKLTAADNGIIAERGKAFDSNVVRIDHKLLNKTGDIA